MIGALFPSLHSWSSMLSHNPIDKSMGSSFVVWGREDNCWHGFGGVFVIIRRSKLGACLILSYFCNEKK
jgi:hypothetical protein